MNHWWKILRVLMVAAALIAVPFSVSHAGMNGDNTDHHVEMTHNHDMQSEVLKSSHFHKSSYSDHHKHDGPDCCSGICGGALPAQQSAAVSLVVSSSTIGFGQDSADPSLSIPPFRPPSI